MICRSITASQALIKFIETERSGSIKDKTMCMQSWLAIVTPATAWNAMQKPTREICPAPRQETFSHCRPLQPNLSNVGFQGPFSIRALLSCTDNTDDIRYSDEGHRSIVPASASYSEPLMAGGLRIPHATSPAPRGYFHLPAEGWRRPHIARGTVRGG